MGLARQYLIMDIQWVEAERGESPRVVGVPLTCQGRPNTACGCHQEASCRHDLNGGKLAAGPARVRMERAQVFKPFIPHLGSQGL